MPPLMMKMMSLKMKRLRNNLNCLILFYFICNVKKITVGNDIVCLVKEVTSQSIVFESLDYCSAKVVVLDMPYQVYIPYLW